MNAEHARRLLAASTNDVRPAAQDGLTHASRLPTGRDYFYYANFPTFAEPAAAAGANARRLLARVVGHVENDEDADAEGEQLMQALTDFLDEALDAADAAIAEAKGEATHLLPRQATAGARDRNPRLAGVPLHVASIAKPQVNFAGAPADGSALPESALVPRPPLADVIAALDASAMSPAGGAFAPPLPPPVAINGSSPRRHPLHDRLASLRWPQWLDGTTPAAGAATPPLSLGASLPAVWVDTPTALASLAAVMRGCPAVAVDVEHHSYRSYRGITCLLQVTPSCGRDYLIDALSLREHLRAALGPVFGDPGVVKVMHGAASDVEWLQADFGIHLVGLLDTHVAAVELGETRVSLGALLQSTFGYVADKRYQLADWRVRPLPPAMVDYARSDTHWLLALADVFRARLSASAPPPPLPGSLYAQHPPLVRVLARSRDITLKCYAPEPMWGPESWRRERCEAGAMTGAQDAALGAVGAWRDATARRHDESLGYVLPRAVMHRLARATPTDARSVVAALAAGSGGRATLPLAMAAAAQIAAAVAAAVAGVLAPMASFPAVETPAWRALVVGTQDVQDLPTHSPLADALTIAAAGSAAERAVAAGWRAAASSRLIAITTALGAAQAVMTNTPDAMPAAGVGTGLEKDLPKVGGRLKSLFAPRPPKVIAPPATDGSAPAPAAAAAPLIGRSAPLLSLSETHSTKRRHPAVGGAVPPPTKRPPAATRAALLASGLLDYDDDDGGEDGGDLVAGEGEGEGRTPGERNRMGTLFGHLLPGAAKARGRKDGGGGRDGGGRGRGRKGKAAPGPVAPGWGGDGGVGEDAPTIKGASKRSAVHARGGNRSETFR